MSAPEQAGGEYQITGPPGTGKTTFLQRSIGEAAHKHGSDAIIVASFTRAAAAELVSRDLPLRRDQIGTLHAHCYRALGHPPVAEDYLEEWNQDSPGFMLSSQVRAEDQEGKSVGGKITAGQTASGDEPFLRYQYLRAIMRPREMWPESVKLFAARWEAWKQSTACFDFTDM